MSNEDIINDKLDSFVQLESSLFIDSIDQYFELDSIFHIKDISDVNSINQFWNCYENRHRNVEFIHPNRIEDTLIKSFNGKLALSSIDDNLVLSQYKKNKGDDCGSIEFEIFGYSPKEYRITNMLIPYAYLNKSEYNVKISSGEIIIPYFNDLDRETTIITKWKLFSDSLKFCGYYKNLICSKYSRVVPKIAFDFNGIQYILGVTEFAEGGEYGEISWIAYVAENDFLNFSEIYSIDNSYSEDTIRSLTYQVIDNVVNIYENYYLITHESFYKNNFIGKEMKKSIELK